MNKNKVWFYSGPIFKSYSVKFMFHCHPYLTHKAGANAGYSEGDSAQQETRAGLPAGESDPAGATATARR
jgi:hypothetical protein